MSLMQGEDTPPLFENSVEVKKPHLQAQMESDLLPEVTISKTETISVMIFKSYDV